MSLEDPSRRDKAAIDDKCCGEVCRMHAANSKLVVVRFGQCDQWRKKLPNGNGVAGITLAKLEKNVSLQIANSC